MGDWRIGRYRGCFCAVRNDDAGKRHRHTLGTTDRDAAERLIAELNRKLRPQVRTVREVWEAYVEDLGGRAVVETMKHTAKAILPRFGHLRPDSAMVDLCRVHTSERRAQGRSDGTIHTELGHLRMALLWGEKRGLIEKASHIERPEKPAPADRHLTREEVNRLLDAATLPHVRLAIVLLIGTGARLEALAELTWDRVDFDRGVIDLRREVGRRRKGRAVVPMNATVRAALSEAQAGALTKHVIEWAGKPVRSLKRALATASERAGLPKVGHHIFRHSAAVWMAEAGVPMSEIAQFLGHGDTKTTERVYARYSPTHLRGAADVLNLDTVRSRA